MKDIYKLFNEFSDDIEQLERIELTKKEKELILHTVLSQGKSVNQSQDSPSVTKEEELTKKVITINANNHRNYRNVLKAASVVVAAAAILWTVSSVKWDGSKNESGEESLVTQNTIPDQQELTSIPVSNVELKGVNYTFTLDEENTIYYSVVADLYYNTPISNLTSLSSSLKEGESIADYPDQFGTYKLTVNGKDISECEYVTKVEVVDLSVDADYEQIGRHCVRQEFRFYLKKPYIEEDLNVELSYSSLIVDGGIVEGTVAAQVKMLQNTQYKDIDKKLLYESAQSSSGTVYDITGYSIEEDGIHIYTSYPLKGEPESIKDGEYEYSKNLQIRAEDDLGNVYVMYYTVTNGEYDFSISNSKYEEYNYDNVTMFDTSAKTVKFQVIEETTVFKGCNYVRTDLEPISNEVTIQLTK